MTPIRVVLHLDQGDVNVMDTLRIRGYVHPYTLCRAWVDDPRSRAFHGERKRVINLLALYSAEDVCRMRRVVLVQHVDHGHGAGITHVAPLHRPLGRSPCVDPRGCLPVPEWGDRSKSCDLGVQFLPGAQADMRARLGV